MIPPHPGRRRDDPFPGFSERDLTRFKDYYRRSAVRESTDARRVGWGSEESQNARFEVFVSLAPLQGLRVLDVGCGLGAFGGYLRARGLSVRYTGVDLFEPTLREARRRHPGLTFEARNLLERPFRPGAFDHGFLSGVFNVRVRDNWAYLRAVVGACLRSCRRGVAFNLLHGDASLRERDRFTVDPAEAVVRCRRLPGVGRVRLVDHYHPNDLTLHLTH
jgi:SAM-dependent methyltransferase